MGIDGEDARKGIDGEDARKGIPPGSYGVGRLGDSLSDPRVPKIEFGRWVDMPVEPRCPATKLCKSTGENLRARPKLITNTNTGDGNHGF